MSTPQIFMVLFMYCSFFIIISGIFAKADVDTKKLYTICSGRLYDVWSDDAYDWGVSSVISDMITNTPKAEYHEYYHKEPLQGQRNIYSHGECQTTLTDDECLECLREAEYQLLKECTHSIGAQTQLVDCRMRYEDYYFDNDG